MHDRDRLLTLDHLDLLRASPTLERLLLQNVRRFAIQRELTRLRIESGNFLSRLVVQIFRSYNEKI